MNEISYSSKTGEIERLCGNIGIMNAYVGDIRFQMSEYIDAPLYQGFRNKAAETISTIHLEDIRTTNTLGVRDIQYTEGYATDAEELKKDLGFEDFLGTADYSGAEPGDQLKAFTAMFQSEYDQLKTAGKLENSKIESVDDYLNEIMSMGEFDHKKDQPLLSFLSGLADITIILSLIEGCAGYDFITGEDLTGFESGMEIVFAVVDVATLGMALGATGVLKAGVSLTANEAVLLLGKTVAIETASNIAGYSTGFMADEAKMPVPLVIMLSILAGSLTSVAGTKLAIKNGAEEGIIQGVEGGTGVVDDIIIDGSHLQNGQLKPNATYKTGEYDYIYKTNEEGLIVNASTDNLQIKTHEGRLDHNPNTYGKDIGDHAGHIFGDRFGGSPELDNLVSQARNVNLSEFKIIENQWATAIKNGQKVMVDIDLNYANGSMRPIAFDLSYTIDGVPFFQTITN